MKSSNQNQDSFSVVVSQPGLRVKLAVGEDGYGVENWSKRREPRRHEAADSQSPPGPALELGIEHNESRDQR
jgi:hypothetical protein